MTDAADFFNADPAVRDLFVRLTDAVRADCSDAVAEVQGTAVTLKAADRPYAYVWMPGPQRIPGRPAHYLVVSFGLNRRIDSPRMTEVTQSYPGRWMHHVIVSTPAEIDRELRGWLMDAREWKVR